MTEKSFTFPTDIPAERLVKTIEDFTNVADRMAGRLNSHFTRAELLYNRIGKAATMNAKMRDTLSSTQAHMVKNYGETVGKLYTLPAASLITNAEKIDLFSSRISATYDTLNALSSSINTLIKGPFSDFIASASLPAEKLRWDYGLMDSVVRRSLDQLDGVQSKQLLDEVVEYMEENDLADDIPEAAITLPIGASTGALKMTVYRVLMVLLVVTMGTTLEPKEIQQVYEFIFDTLGNLMNAIDFSVMVGGRTEQKEKE
ncbi:hypothetical protein [Peribacillus sp. SCS-155]|uniref:hypothetical protein n=1 Tax=Peribacillus sedimenti TaxID=3115297 RepID=UPI003906555B